MVAFAGADPIGVLIGAKRPTGTLIHRIAIHPDHQRQGHGRHLLASLGSKLAILGPPRMIAEVPATLAPACALCEASGYVQEALLTDYVLERQASDVQEIPGRFVIPVTVDDLAANGLLGDADPPVCWERSVETLTARKGDLAGLAVASAEGLEAAILLYMGHAGGPEATTEIALLRSFTGDAVAGLAPLLARAGAGRFRFPKVHPAEISREGLEALGFRPAGRHVLYAATAQSA